MFRGLYAGASAMLVQERMLDVTGNNLANVNSTGFRGRTPVNKAFPTLLMEKIDGQPGETFPPKPEWLRRRDPIQDAVFANVLSETAMSIQAGAVRVTDNPLDVALEGPGFFVVADGAGNTFYTRAGHFVRDNEGRLATHEGQLVQGQGGTITLGEGWTAHIDDGGQVVVDGEVVDRLQVVTFDNPTYLRQAGRSLLQETAGSGAPQEEANPTLARGALEMSNVNVVSEMVRMVEANRAYEAAAKAVSVQDESASRLTQTYGRV
ncbi:MAG TPA: flagellar hook-basal body protein [Synergistaceae bacterium]|nr:flagellar hook-basal body protein [Synergistaceae bacterium]HQH79055.1 flagellar hook-basal body protein [Synergistaceae bacterium]